MTQDEFNTALLNEVRQLALEVYRSTPSYQWDDLNGCRQRLEHLGNRLPVGEMLPSAKPDKDGWTPDSPTWPGPGAGND